MSLEDEDESLTDDDFQTLQIPTLRTFVWNTQHGFLSLIPPELSYICGQIEREGVTGALFSEICKGRYVYWSWQKDWIIAAGFKLSCDERGDAELLDKVKLSTEPLPPTGWIDPPSLIDLNLGDALLKSAKFKYSDFSSTPILLSPPRAQAPSPVASRTPTQEILYGMGDSILKLEMSFPTFLIPQTQPTDRINHLRKGCTLKLHLKELLHAKISSESPTIIFGPAVGGFHLPLFREGSLRTHSIEELESLASKDIIIIGIKEKTSKLMARFEVSSIPFVNLLKGCDKRIKELSNSTSLWAQRSVTSIQTSRPLIPTDREFLSQYILVGNIDPSSFDSKENCDRLKDMCRKLAAHKMEGCEVDEDELQRSFGSTPTHIRPLNLGLEESKAVRSTKVIKLKEQVRVGVSLRGGTPLLARAQTNDPSAEYGIYLTRQFLSDKEAELLIRAETTNLDITLLMARRLTKKTELDDLIRRSFKSTLESILKCEVFVWVNTIRHRWNGDANSEESFLLAATSSTSGGKAIGRSFPGFEDGAPYCKLGIGSLELECFTDLKQIVNKPWMDSFNVTQTVEIGRVEPGQVTGDILRELGGYTSHDILGIAKCDPRTSDDRWDRWLLLVNSDKTTCDWEKDPRPESWTVKGWTHTIRRSPSPQRNTHDKRNYTTVTWDPDGCTVSKVTKYPIKLTSNAPSDPPLNGKQSKPPKTNQNRATPTGDHDPKNRPPRIMSERTKNALASNDPKSKLKATNCKNLNPLSKDDLRKHFPSPQNASQRSGNHPPPALTTPSKKGSSSMDPQLEDKIDKRRRELFPEGLDADNCRAALCTALREQIGNIGTAPLYGSTVTTMLMEFDTEIVLNCIVDDDYCSDLIQQALEVIDSQESGLNTQPHFPPIPPHPPHEKPPAPPNGLDGTDNMGGRNVKSHN